MESMEVKVSYSHHQSQFEALSQQTFLGESQLHLVEEMQLHSVNQTLLSVYRKGHQHVYLLCALQVLEEPPSIVAKRWGQSLSSLSEAHIQSYVKQSWIVTLLSMFAGMRESLPKIKSKELLIESNEEPKVLVTDYCQTEGEFVLDFKQIVHIMFRHVKAILSRCDRVGSLQDIEQWLEEATPSRQAQTITQLVELRNRLPKVQTSDRIPLKEEDRRWIMQATGHQLNSKLELVYDGQINQFDPEKLLQVANRQQLLFLFETTKGKRAAFWMAARPDIHSNHLFGSYYPDKSRKSVLLGLDNRSVHALEDEDNSVGFGKEILLAVGRVDLVFSAFNCSNVSYFPSSYGKGVGKAEDLLGRDFLLRQFEAFRVSWEEQNQ